MAENPSTKHPQSQAAHMQQDDNDGGSLRDLMDRLHEEILNGPSANQDSPYTHHPSPALHDANGVKHADTGSPSSIIHCEDTLRPTTTCPPIKEETITYTPGAFSLGTPTMLDNLEARKATFLHRQGVLHPRIQIFNSPDHPEPASPTSDNARNMVMNDLRAEQQSATARGADIDLSSPSYIPLTARQIPPIRALRAPAPGLKRKR